MKKHDFCEIFSWFCFTIVVVNWFRSYQQMRKICQIRSQFTPQTKGPKSNNANSLCLFSSLFLLKICTFIGHDGFECHKKGSNAIKQPRLASVPSKIILYCVSNHFPRELKKLSDMLTKVFEPTNVIDIQWCKEWAPEK